MPKYMVGLRNALLLSKCKPVLIKKRRVKDHSSDHISFPHYSTIQFLCPYNRIHSLLLWPWISVGSVWQFCRKLQLWSSQCTIFFMKLSHRGADSVLCSFWRPYFCGFCSFVVICLSCPDSFSCECYSSVLMQFGLCCDKFLRLIPLKH